MKRIAALLLACCILASALCIPVFATDDSILNRLWSCGVAEKSITTTSMVGLIFDASYSSSGFGSSTVGKIYDTASHPSASGFSSISSPVLIPAGSTISLSVTVQLSGINGFGQSATPYGALAVYSVDSTGSCSSQLRSFTGVQRTLSGSNWLYKFSGSWKTTSNIYSAFILDFSTAPSGLNGSTFAGKTITLSVSDSNIRVTSLAATSSAAQDQINNTVNNIYNTVINNNTEVVAQITNVVGILDKLFDASVTVNAYLDSLVGEINLLGDDLDSVLAYLQNVYNQLTHISSLVEKISSQLEISNNWFSDIAGKLITIDTDVNICSTYLQGLYNTLSMMAGDLNDARDFLQLSADSIGVIASTLVEVRDILGSQIMDQLGSIFITLVQSGQDIAAIKTAISAISRNLLSVSNDTKSMVKSLDDLNSELQQIGEGQQETNDRLGAIQKLLENFEIKDSKSTNNVLSSGDQKGLGAIVSKLITHLLSVVDFVSDLFGSVFTSVPSTISAYNDCTSFWGDQKTYVYTPHQISGYTEQGGSTYENSNESVQSLFAEAEKYLGYPYVFGGSSPETSFDCSGFVCYVLNHSALSDFPIGRTTAQGLYDMSVHVSRADAKAGDLVFFTGTYDCADIVSHIGIYAGDGKMIHCGNPIQYESIDTPYWQAHFYAFGRLYYNY